MSIHRQTPVHKELAAVAALGLTFSLSLVSFLAATDRGGIKELLAKRGAAGAATSPADPAGSVSGRIEEANVGSLRLVDGLAYRAAAGGVVVYATTKPIASAALAGSACPMTQARALSVLRNAGWAEVTLDAAGRSPYFAYGTQYDGRSRASDPGGHYVSTSLDEEAGRAEGKAKHADYGGFTFDLPILAPALAEPSENDRFASRIWSANPKTPTEAEAVAAYQALRGAALAKDLDALLAAQGFSAAQIAAVRALPGIDADLAAHADRFLTPGDLSPEDEVQLDTGYAQLAAIGKNSKGEPFFNVYELAPCADKLVLVGIYLNPQ